MGENSKIEWTDHTFNPWIGCTKVSAGCRNCYAEADMDKRRGRAKWGDAGTRSITSATYWRQPFKWNQQAKVEGERRRVFCASLADVFEDWKGHVMDASGEAIWWPEKYVDDLAFQNYYGALTIPSMPVTLDLIRRKLFRLIENTPCLDWLLLTKRPENIMAKVPESWRHRFPANVWVGTSVENQEAADTRIPKLLQVPAAIRFLSCEPLLGPVDLSEYISLTDTNSKPEHWEKYGWMYDDWSGGFMGPGQNDAYDARSGIHWIIAGGESGSHARPMHPDWVRSLRDQCQSAGVPFFFKQYGDWSPIDQPWKQDNIKPLANNERWLNLAGGYGFHGDEVWRIRKVGKKAAGHLLDGREWNEFPHPQNQY